MEVQKQQRGNVLELSIKGRLDNYWSEYLAEHLNTVINDGAHHLRLDLSQVNYLSSAGIGVLVRIHQQLQAIQGSFVISDASQRVRAVLKLVALEPILFGATPGPKATAATPASHPQTFEVEEGTLDVYPLPSTGAMECRLTGDARMICGTSLPADSCHGRPMSNSTLALGIGALGVDYNDCRGRFGEFLSVAGCSAYLPTDGTSVPDYLLSTERLVPEVQVLYAIECHGAPAKLLRFECRQDARLSLSGIARHCLQVSGATTVAIALLAETGNVVGATLSSSPAVAPVHLDFPAIRDSMCFMPAAAGARSTALVAGVASCNPWPGLAPFLRPLERDGNLGGHFHAALFPYRPIQRGFLDLVGAAHNLFQSQSVASVLHLLNDRRPLSGAGETTLVRGACWIAPLAPGPETVA